MRRGPKPAKSKEAKPPGARKPPKDDARLRNLEKRLAEAQEQQAATSEILGVISRSPTDVEPVFETITRNAVRLCDGINGHLYRFDGELVHLAAHANVSGHAWVEWQQTFPRPLSEAGGVRHVMETGQVLNVADFEDFEGFTPAARALWAATGIHSTLLVPMMFQGQAIGAIVVNHRNVAAFSDARVELLRTFADQAVIAIENVRLFDETKEALERQTATSEILRVISQSPTDVRPVFEAIVSNAARLCDAEFSAVARYDSNMLHLVALNSMSPEESEAWHALFPRSPQRSFIMGRACVDGRTVHVDDVLTDPDYDLRTQESILRMTGYRTFLGIPITREGVPLGVIGCGRRTVKPFTPTQIELVKTFADQAVIAIENVRLFTETKEALEQQTATSEILRVISQSPTDAQPVFEAIAESALHLCDSSNSVVGHYDGDLLHLAAHAQQTAEAAEALRRTFPIRPSRGTASGRAVLEGTVVHIADVQADPEYAQPLAEVIRARATLAVPMLRDGQPIGTIAVGWLESRPFSDKHVALLQTFADQAVIAIENVRLFKELETRNHDLTTALNRQTATSEILKVISSSPTDAQPVFEAIVRSVQRLSGAYSSSLTRLVDGEQQLTASSSTTPSGDAALRAMYPLRLTQTPLLAQALAKREPSLVEDAEADPRITLLAREIARQRGIRSWLNLPLIHRDSVIGVITVGHAQPRAFTRDDIELLRTFADQAVIAIENVRLFKELEVANRELSAASQHKSEFLANMSHELRTPLNAIIGFSEVLAEKMFGELNEKQEEYSKDIHASGQHLLSLINDILDLSKIEAGRMELELSDFHLPTALDSALTLVRERAGRRSIALHTSIDNRLGQIQADERKVRQVVLNLLSNAIKFTPEGGRIEVAAAPRDGSVEVSVSDTGVGIAPEDQEAVFEEFRQVGTADKKVEGTGLGLTLCRKFIELHGGQIWVKSELGAGATFTFSLPLRNA